MNASEQTGRNSEMDDTVKRGNNRTSTYIALVLGVVAFLFYVIAWLKFWH